MTATLADIVPLTETVQIRGRTLEVRGLEIEDIVPLVMRFPELRDVFSGNAAAALPKIRQAHSALVAAGLGLNGNDEEELGIFNLSLGERLTLSNAILRLTGGFGPFVEMMTMLGLTDQVEGVDQPAAKTLPLGKFRGQRHRSNGLSQSASTA